MFLHGIRGIKRFHKSETELLLANSSPIICIPRKYQTGFGLMFKIYKSFRWAFPVSFLSIMLIGIINSIKSVSDYFVHDWF